MDTILSKGQEKRGINKLLIGGAVVGLAVVGIAVWLLSFRPPMDEQIAQMLNGAYREGSPEFAEITKDIIISTDDRTVESPTGMGTISMFINGKIRNKGTKTITVLEVNVGVVTQFNKVLKERRIVVVPVQQSTLAPGETIPITLTMDGFTKDDDRANIRWKVTAIKTKQ
jgi:hypothetical protein